MHVLSSLATEFDMRLEKMLKVVLSSAERQTDVTGTRLVHETIDVCQKPSSQLASRDSFRDSSIADLRR